MLEILGSSLFDECSETQLKNTIQIYLKNEQPGCRGVINLYREDFDTILTQFIALGLIQISEKKAYGKWQKCLLLVDWIWKNEGNTTEG